MRSEGGAVTYVRMLEAQSAQLANMLVESGCVKGDRVAAQVEKSAMSLCVYLAALRAGLVYLPLNTGYQSREMAYFLGDAKPRVVVCPPAAKDLIAAVAPDGARVFTLDERGQGSLADAARHCGDRFATVDVAPDDLASIVYTSGTTGRSKGAMLSHRNLASNGLTLVDYWGFTAGDVLYHALPIYHVHGLFVASHCVLLSGSRMWFSPKFDVNETRKLLPQSTVMMGVPTFYTRLLANADFGRDDCRTIRLFISGSAPLLPETFAQFEARTGQLLERYGMTETGMNIAEPA
jgi:malonyl-CoA/methylmalonyl-CoA synthetase